MSESLENATIGEIVATDFRAAGVFEEFGIDFCCGGRQSLADACRTAAADPATVVRALRALPPSGEGHDEVTDWPVERLIDYIVSMHHTYVRSAIPTIRQYLTKLVEVHGTRHPELSRVAATFDHLGRDLMQHLMKEEQVLFPYLHELARQENKEELSSPFGTVENPIRMMEREHRDAGDELRLLHELTQGYTAPADGCTTYQVGMAELARFEHDLHRHIHLENNVLFPKAVALERHA